jgi:serine/threonine-protein kinase
MDPQRWRAVRAELEAILTLDVPARAARLAAIADQELRADVEALLARMDEPDTVLDRSAGAIAAPLLERLMRGAGADSDDPFIGRTIGRFRLESLLGVGGMGRVYRARRAEDGIDQVVALKLMLSADPSLRDRFLRERAILSALRHPGIAQLIDVGSTPEGLPYLVMQYVEGEPLADYCMSRGLGLADRLRLLLRVATALAHAHRNLVVHRDLKPGNIVVTAEGDPILLDFGIAKLVDAGFDGHATREAHGPMTPAYAAPEQFRGEPIGVATDIYQFGVLLYRLVSGRLPYAASTEDPVNWARAVLERPPLTLSRALREATTSVEPGGPGRGVAVREIGPDLEAIVRMALAKDPADRYSSIDALAADLRAFLDGRPVLARHGGRLYEFARFVRRNSVAVSGSALAAAGLLSLTGYAVHQGREARAEAERARAAVDFVNEVFKAADPSGGAAANRGIGDLLDVAAAEMQPRLEAHPDLRGPLNGLVAGAWLRVGRLDRALPLYERAIADLDAHAAVSPRERLDVFERAAFTAQRSGRRDLAERWATTAEAELGRVEPARAVEAADTLASIRWAIATEDGDHRRALGVAEGALARIESATLADRDPLRLRALNRVAISAASVGDLERAEAIAVEALALAERIHGSGDVRSLRQATTLAWVQTQAGKGAAALERLGPLGPSWIELRGENSQDYATHLSALGEAHRVAGDLREALRQFFRSAEVYVASGGPDSAQAGDVLLEAGRVLLELGEVEAARAALRDVARHWRVSVAADAPIRIRLELARAEAELAAGALPAARVHARAAFDLAQTHGDEGARTRAQTLIELGATTAAPDRPESPSGATDQR